MKKQSYREDLLMRWVAWACGVSSLGLVLRLSEKDHERMLDVCEKRTDCPKSDPQNSWWKIC